MTTGNTRRKKKKRRGELRSKIHLASKKKKRPKPVRNRHIHPAEHSLEEKAKKPERKKEKKTPLPPRAYPHASTAAATIMIDRSLTRPDAGVGGRRRTVKREASERSGRRAACRRHWIGEGGEYFFLVGRGEKGICCCHRAWVCLPPSPPFP